MTEASSGESPRHSALQFASIFGSAVVVSQLGQIAWLVAGSRALGLADFGIVLSAQALYGLLQYAVDNGTAFHGARLAAARSLGERTRSSVVRVRLELAALAALVAVAVGAIGGFRLLLAVGPFVVALFLFAILSYWERFGLGDSRPWSAYLVVRACGPALVAGAFLLSDAEMPVWAPGTVECLGIAAVATAFGLGPLESLRSGLLADRTAWRSAVAVGLPNLLWQLGVLCGPVLFGAASAAAAAAVMAVAVRLVTGVNQICGIVATSLYPGLARAPDSERLNLRVVAPALQTILALAASAFAVLLVAPGFFVAAFLDHQNETAEATIIVALGASGCVAYLLLATMLLVARRHEAVTLRAYGLGTGVALVVGVAIVIVHPDSEPVLMASAFMVAQVVNVLLVTRGAVARLPALQRPLIRGATLACALAGTGGLAAGIPIVRLPIAIGLLTMAGITFASVAGGFARTWAVQEGRGRTSGF